MPPRHSSPDIQLISHLGFWQRWSIYALAAQIALGKPLAPWLPGYLAAALCLPCLKAFALACGWHIAHGGFSVLFLAAPAMAASAGPLLSPSFRPKNPKAYSCVLLGIALSFSMAALLLSIFPPSWDDHARTVAELLQSQTQAASQDAASLRLALLPRNASKSEISTASAALAILERRTALISKESAKALAERNDSDEASFISLVLSACMLGSFFALAIHWIRSPWLGIDVDIRLSIPSLSKTFSFFLLLAKLPIHAAMAIPSAGPCAAHALRLCLSKAAALRDRAAASVESAVVSAAMPDPSARAALEKSALSRAAGGHPSAAEAPPSKLRL